MLFVILESDCCIMASPYLHVQWSGSHFAEGRFRRAYKGTFLGPLDKYGETAVVKENKESYVWKSTGWDTCVKMNNEAQALATKFNRFSRTTFPVNFTDVTVGRVTESNDPDSTPKLNEYVVVEDYIPGTFTKWCNNYGYISAEAKQNAASMPAFMHWSWVNSSGEKMISDLQGVRKGNPPSYTLTDSAILSISGQYGVTDTGVEGMAMFFLHHQCNGFCKELPKPELSDFIGIIPQTQLSATMQLLQQVENATTYTHELKFSPRVREGVATVFRRVARGY